MAITIQKRPNDRCWSGNPIYYQLYSAAAEADAANYFEIAIFFQRRDEADFTEIIRLPYYPVAGTARIDVKEIIDSLLEYELPNLGIGFVYENALITNRMTGHLYIKYREITVADPDPVFATDVANDIFVIKGGISYQKWRGDNYWVNYFDVVKPFLTWQESGRMASLVERMYLTWLNLTDVAVGSINMRRKLVMTDGTEYFAYIDFPVPKYDVGYFPCGATQLMLDDVDVTKTIWYWELQVFDIAIPASPAALSGAFRYDMDNRHDQNAECLNYRNSLGGLDSVRIRGVIEFQLNREFTQIERTVLSNYYINHFIEGRIAAANSTEWMIYKGDIGHLGKEEQDRLRDIHLQRECWKEDTDKWMPVLILTGNQRLRTNADKLFNMPIEFAVASGPDSYYTPKNVNLGEGNEAVVALCDVVINNPSYIEDVSGWTVSWDLVSGSPNRYFISTPGVSGGAPRDAGSATNYLFDWLPVGENVITITPICLIGSDYHFGTPIQITIVVAATCTGVTGDGAFNPPDAVTGVPYTYEYVLNGTQPFAIGLVETKPDWMFISLVDDVLSFTGTPLASSSEVPIKLTVHNCLYNNSLLLEAEILIA